MSIWDWLESPSAQLDPHYWAATYAGHIAIGSGLWLALIYPAMFFDVDPALLAALVAAVAYALIWEGVQLACFKAGLWDSILDAVGVAFGALVIAFVARHELGFAICAALAAAVVAAVGVKVRK